MAVNENPPAEIREALHRMGLLERGATAQGARLTGGVSSDIWRIDLPSGPVCVKRALAKLRVAADWRAPVERNLYEARWMRTPMPRCPAAAPALLGQDARLGVLAMQYLPPDHYRALEDAAARRRRRSGVRRARSAATLARIHAATAARSARSPANSRPMRSSSTSGWIPICSPPARAHPDLAAALDALVDATAGTTRRAGARRRQPEEHPRRPARPGVPRRRVRVVGRPGVRPRVLPQSPAAEMPLDAGGDRGLPRLLRRARRRLPRAASTGSRRRRSKRAPRACCRGCCSRASTASRRSSTSPTKPRSDRGAPRRARAAARARSTRLGDVARGMGEGARA